MQRPERVLIFFSVMAFLDQYGRSLFQWRPRPSEEDEECSDLIRIARTARKRGDQETLEKLRPVADAFFGRHPGCRESCWGAEFERNYAVFIDQ